MLPYFCLDCQKVYDKNLKISLVSGLFYIELAWTPRLGLPIRPLSNLNAERVRSTLTPITIIGAAIDLVQLSFLFLHLLPKKSKFVYFGSFPTEGPDRVKAGNTKGVSITVPLTSCLTGLD